MQPEAVAVMKESAAETRLVLGPAAQLRQLSCAEPASTWMHSQHAD